jgi:hypothetical protein
MKPAVWGKHVWYSIHFISLEYPLSPSEKDKETYFEFYRNLAKVLPCAVCREHFKKIWKWYPLTTDALQSRESLFAWTVQVHNMVNEDLGKPEMPLSQARDLYTNRMRYKYKKSISPNGACESPLPVQPYPIHPSPLDSSVDLMEAFTAVSLILLIMLNIKKNGILSGIF